MWSNILNISLIRVYLRLWLAQILKTKSRFRVIFVNHYVIILFDPQNSYKKRYLNTHNWVSWRCLFQTPLSIIDSKIFWSLQCFDRNLVLCPRSYPNILAAIHVHLQYLPKHAPLILQSGGCKSGGCWWPETLKFTLLMLMVENGF